ncbi:unnamed protein product [Onchocerca flexuosa]|uniref:Uncharacterized protein n=1 Tax=Onchocerca flexuosa TaxID=387005 RepID=A0A183I7B6_9BILA|nr:unnamed protein product [Onchocerca flexuosa]
MVGNDPLVQSFPVYIPGTTGVVCPVYKNFHPH